jgi:hypothetical protein
MRFAKSPLLIIVASLSYYSCTLTMELPPFNQLTTKFKPQNLATMALALESLRAQADEVNYWPNNIKSQHHPFQDPPFDTDSFSWSYENSIEAQLAQAQEDSMINQSCKCTTHQTSNLSNCRPQLYLTSYGIKIKA